MDTHLYLGEDYIYSQTKSSSGYGSNFSLGSLDT